MRKYEITDIAHPDTPSLHRIRAVVDILKYGIKAGDLGGYIEKESNLSHEGNCWVYGTARVCGNAVVYGNAEVRGNAEVCGNARVCVCVDRKSTRLNSSHEIPSRMPSSA